MFSSIVDMHICSAWRIRCQNQIHKTLRCFPVIIPFVSWQLHCMSDGIPGAEKKEKKDGEDAAAEGTAAQK